MGIRRQFLYLFFAALMIVSFQNCGQQGALQLENQGQGKLASNDLIDVSDVQSPPVGDDQSHSDPVYVPPKGDGSVEVDPPVVIQPYPNPPKEDEEKDSCDHDDDKETSDVVDADDDGNLKGNVVSCADLLKVRIPAIGREYSGSSTFKNTRFILTVDGRQNLSVENHRGLLLLKNIGTISKLDNVRSIYSRVHAKAIRSINNFRALSLIDSQTVESLTKYRGLSCVAATVKNVENYRGILEIRGDVGSVKNFRGILKVQGNVDSIENFRGVLVVSGQVGSKKNVKIRAH